MNAVAPAAGAELQQTRRDGQALASRLASFRADVALCVLTRLVCPPIFHCSCIVCVQVVDEGSLLFGLAQALKKDSSSDSSISSYN